MSMPLLQLCRDFAGATHIQWHARFVAVATTAQRLFYWLVFLLLLNVGCWLLVVGFCCCWLSLLSQYCVDGGSGASTRQLATTCIRVAATDKRRLAIATTAWRRYLPKRIVVGAVLHTTVDSCATRLARWEPNPVWRQQKFAYNFCCCCCCRCCWQQLTCFCISALIFAAAAVSVAGVAFDAAFLLICHNHHFAFLTFVASCNYKFINNTTRLYIVACLLLCFLLAVSRSLSPFFMQLLFVFFLSLLLFL